MKEYKDNELKFAKDLLVFVKKNKKKTYVCGEWHLGKEKDPISEFVSNKYSYSWNYCNNLTYINRLVKLTGLNKEQLLYLAEVIDNVSLNTIDTINKKDVIKVLEEEINFLKVNK